jgi:alkaline phosphatase D
VGTSISSFGDGRAKPAFDPTETHPHVKWHADQRGYITCTVTPDAWTAEYRTMPFVTRPDAPIETPSRWRLTHGRAGIERV